MTKKERRDYYVQRYINSEYRSVIEAYTEPSSTKKHIEASILAHMLARDGKRYRVVCFNCFYFTCAYVYPNNGTWILVVETSGKHLEYDLTDKEVNMLYL